MYAKRCPIETFEIESAGSVNMEEGKIEQGKLELYFQFYENISIFENVE